MNKTISIIIPAYNAEKYIEQCVESVIHQTYADLEIIIVIDDTSVDCTNEKVEQIANLDKRIIFYFWMRTIGLSRLAVKRSIGQLQRKMLIWFSSITLKNMVQSQFRIFHMDENA